MANTEEDAPLARGSTAGSEEALVLRAGTGGGSNSRALKVAGLTTLACLLLGSQVFTAYMVLEQRQQVKELQGNNERMSKQLTHSFPAVAPVKMRVPVRSLPMMPNYLENDNPTRPKPTEKETVVSLEKQVKELLKDFTPPLFNSTFISNLLALKEQMNETVWQEFESWMRFWLIFQIAQQKLPVVTTTTAPAKTKCQEEAGAAPRKLGSHRPQCDEQGQYKPIQCWHAIGYCWCVDRDGVVIEGTTVLGRPVCPRAASRGRAMIAPMEMALLKPGDE